MVWLVVLFSFVPILFVLCGSGISQNNMHINTASEKNYLIKPSGQYGVRYNNCHLINAMQCPDKLYDSVRSRNFSKDNYRKCNEILLRVYYQSIDGQFPYFCKDNKHRPLAELYVVNATGQDHFYSKHMNFSDYSTIQYEPIVHQAMSKMTKEEQFLGIGNGYEIQRKIFGKSYQTLTNNLHIDYYYSHTRQI